MTALRSTALAASLILAALPAFAQGGGGNGPGWGPMMGNGGGYGGGPMMGGYGYGGRGMMPMTGMMAQGGFGHVEGRLAYLKTELKITEAQKPQWTAFVKAVEANANSMAGRRRTMMTELGNAKTLPERLALEQQAMAAHVDAMTTMQGALSALYDTLSPEQKKSADDIVIGPMGTPMGMGMF